jgi:hypothetical protein
MEREIVSERGMTQADRQGKIVADCRKEWTEQ